MTRQTTTQKINTALSNNLLKVKKVETYYKTSRKTNVIDVQTFLENFQFLCESGAFMDCIGWHYQKDCNTYDYICETGRMNGDSENIITVYLRVGDGVGEKDVENALNVIEEE